MVEQVDRDAAAAIYDGLHGYGCSKTEGMADHIRRGLIDDNLVVVACYNHRIAAEARGMERAAQIVDQCNRDGPYNAIGASKLIRAALNGGQPDYSDEISPDQMDAIRKLAALKGNQ